MEWKDAGEDASIQIRNNKLTHKQNKNFALNIFFKLRELLFRYKRATGMK